MPFVLPLAPPLPAQGWKVKIRDRERLEPPHVTILRNRKAWRLDLRSRGFLDREPDPSEIPAELRAVIEANWERLCAEWDQMYPENPVSSGVGDDE